MNRMNASNISNDKLAKTFVDYINTAPAAILKNTYKNDVVEDEDCKNTVGKFRLIHIVDPVKNEYLTFTACFYDEDDGTKTLIIHNIEKNEVNLDCTFNPELNSWSSNRQIQGITVSSVTSMAIILKSIL